MKMYLVGGAVRDSILGLNSKDKDYAVEANSFDEMLEEIQGMVAKPTDVFEIRPEYSTVRANVPALGAVDFVLTRKDGKYTDGRRPDSVEIGTIYDDLARRDFTMNAIAMTVDGKIIDPHNGVEDIQNRLIRTVGNPYDRFSEDSLRMIRAIRFAVTKGFELHVDVRMALHDPSLVAMLENVSTERMREEMERAFKHDTLATLEMLGRYRGLRAAIFNGSNGLRLSATMKG